MNPALPLPGAPHGASEGGNLTPGLPAGLWRRSRWATSAQFVALGVFSGAWGAHIPSIKQGYGLSDGGVAGVLLAGALGAVVSLQGAGRVVARLGVRRVCWLAGCGLGGLMSLALLWPNLPCLLVAMLFTGALGSVLDVAINAEGTALESLGGRSVMGGLHGMFSAGGMVGAAVGAALLRAGWAPELQLAGVGAVVALTTALGARGLLPEPLHQPAAPPAPATTALPSAAPSAPPRRRWGRLPPTPLLLIGLLTLCGMTAEGVMYDWSVLYLKEALGQPQDRAALAYAVFSAAMAGTRLAGDRLRDRVAQPVLLRSGALVAGGAMLAVLLLGHPGVALLGFALVGMGLALVVPMLYKAATLVPGTERAQAIAAVSSVGYAGFLMGPPLIGGLAQALNLTAALGVVVVACAALAWGARRI